MIRKELDKKFEELLKAYGLDEESLAKEEARKKNKYYIMMNDIMDKYKKENIIFIFTDEKLDYCYLDTYKVYISKNQYENADAESVFNLLHEIGHLKSNKPGMKRCEEEYYATVWAIKKSKKYNIKIPKYIRNSYQEYIYNWRTSAIKKHAKIVPSIKELTLIW